MFTSTMVVYLCTRWKLVLPHLYKLLSQSEFIQSDSNASWQKYQKVILLSQKSSDKGGQLDNEHTQSVLLNSLILAGVNAAILPDHLTTVLTTHIRFDSIPGYLQQIVHPMLSGLSAAGVEGRHSPKKMVKNEISSRKFSNHSCISFTSVYVPPHSPPHRRSIPGDSPACYVMLS